LPYSPCGIHASLLCREYEMGTIQEHRMHAELCVAKAQTTDDHRDKALWLTLAQSWAQLAEYAARVNNRAYGESATGAVDLDEVEDAHAPH
jgi:putative IMPACT (imprinted ancient) family translation regulator